jgi:hypothetical protein
MKPRAYQREALKALRHRRLFCLLFERQAGKTTTIGRMALFEMMKHPGRVCIYASASLLLAKEIIFKQISATEQSARALIQKESEVLFAAAAVSTAEAHKAGLDFQTVDVGSPAKAGRALKAPSLTEFMELFEAQRLEFRLYHDRTTFSRTQIIAPNPATARGWTGTVFLDEIGFIKNFSELWIAIEPIISTDAQFKLILATTPPQDDTHYCFELLAPPAGVVFQANPSGNWYESEAGVPVLRADAYDTHAAGKKIFDVRTGDEIAPAESFRRAINKDGWRINHGLQWLLGGSAACDLLRLKVAQERGIGCCQCALIDSDADFDQAMTWLERTLANRAGDSKFGLGFDVATTTKEKSNPSVLAVLEQRGLDMMARQFLVWKTRDPDVAIERLSRTLDVLEKCEARPRALAVDATNEKYFAENLRKEFRGRVPVLLVVSSETVDKPGLEKPTNWKEYLGDQYVGLLDDNHLTLPPEQYVRIDHRLVRKDRGRYMCEPDADGRHGDTFDAGKLSVHALLKRGGPAWAMPMSTGNFSVAMR